MKQKNYFRSFGTWWVLVLVLLAAPLGAQPSAGNLFGSTLDNNGAPLPGVQVTLLGAGAPQTVTTDSEGGFRYFGLAPGSYEIRAELEGFRTTLVQSVAVSVGRDTTLPVTLELANADSGAASVEESVVVVGSPLLDEHKIRRGPAITQVELEKIPTSRDPWAILNTAPGVLSDRINVAGSESGQQSNFVSPGTNSGNSNWIIDGVVITDVSALGSSPSYYNFDSFAEIEVGTGGSDVSIATGGVALNMVTKKGNNEWRFSARYLLTDEDWQSGFNPDAGSRAEAGPWNQGSAQGEISRGNRIVEVQDYGLEGGGPVIEDKLWFWGSYGVQDVGLLTVNDVSDTTDLENYAGKLNAQLGRGNELVGFFHFGDKTKAGRDAGPLRPQETTWNQDGPTSIYKLEDSHLVSQNFFLVGMASYVDGIFNLAPQGGGVGDPTFPNVVRGPDSVWKHSFLDIATSRPQQQAKLDGSWFFTAGQASHELKFGAGYRLAETESASTWPGQQLVGLADLALAPDVYVAFSRTDRNIATENEFQSLFFQDTASFGRLTANLGVRYDRQTGRNLPSTISAAPIDAGGVLSGGSFAGGDAGFEWESITPRLGLTWAVSNDRSTLLRASYSQFADQLGAPFVSNINPSGSQYGYFFWNDTNRDLELTDSEVGRFFAFAGVDPTNPGLATVNATDPKLEAPLTEELVLGVEHALAKEFVVGFAATARRYHDIVDFERLVIDEGAAPGSIGRRHRADDYTLSHRITGTLPSGESFDVPFYTLKPGLVSNRGTLLENGDTEQEYLGLTLSAHKRLADRWMLRGHIQWTDWTWKVPASENEDPTLVLPGANVDGGAVLAGGATNSGPKGDVFINSNWSFDLSALYQVAPEKPWGFNVAAHVNGREGYPVPYNIAFDPQDGLGARNVLVGGDVERFRVDDVLVVNARLEKELSLGEVGLILSLDGFNLTNEAFALQRGSTIAGSAVDVATGQTAAIGSQSGDFVREVISPRIFRLGARLSFR